MRVNRKYRVLRVGLAAMIVSGVVTAETDSIGLLSAPAELGTAQAELYEAMELLNDHINGVVTLTTAQINTQAGIVNTRKNNIGDNSIMLNEAFRLVDAYETIKGPLFINGTTSGGFSRTDTSTVNKALAHAMLKVQQALIEDGYNSWNLKNNRAALEGSKFLTADYFPGAVTPPADPDALYSVRINASQPKAWGYPVQFMEEPARRPTGAYLAPGSIATVTVPQALVNKGFQIRVGAHVADLSNKDTIKRIDRVSVVYPITTVDTLVANPLGGGIYIEVPYEVEEGLVTVQIKNTVRSPFYSNSAARQTTLSEWVNTERNHPGPWTDFETDKTMFNLPTSWVYNYADPVTLMNNWDKAMDAVSDLQGLPLIRPKTVLYAQIDVLMDAGAFSPGYPQSNDSYNPATVVNGNKDHDYLNGPKFSAYHHLHELGHACYLTKFTGETEATVNLLYVPVHHRKFGVDLDVAFGRSMGGEGCGTVSRVEAALTWILSDKFRNGEAMDQYDMKYQHRGYGKYVEIAGLFGWGALGDFWHSVAVDYENGIEYPRNTDPTDSRILRMSKAAGWDLLPLIHFWGVHPNNPTWLTSAIPGAGLKKSAKIYDRLLLYKSKVPMGTSGFNTHYWNVDAAPIDNAWYDTMRTEWNSTLGQASKDRVQEIIDLYFPNGRPAEGIVQSYPYAESFESASLGEWDQGLDDDFDWTLGSSPHHRTDTGPSAPSHGSYYIYLHADSDGGSYKTATVECTFDFSTARNPELTFDYHMYGQYINTLAVDVYDGTTWHSGLWSRSGQQHTTPEDPWSSAAVNLTQFAGNSEVTIRFRGRTGEWNKSDTAIDNIQIKEGPQSLPYFESFESGFGVWTQLTGDDFDWTRNSGGTPTDNTGPGAASHASYYLYIEPHDDYDGHNKMAAIECAFDLSQVDGAELQFDYHMYGDNIDYLAVDICVGSSWSSNVWIRTGAQHAGSESAWSSAVVDLTGHTGNDRVIIRFRAKERYWHLSDIAIDKIRVVGPPQSLPYAESFESGWGAWLQSYDDDYDWTHNSGGTPTTGAGPSGASDGSYYIYSEGHHGQGSYKVGGVECRFDLRGVDNAVMSFDYHMCGFFIEYLALDLYDGTSWASNVWIRTGRQHDASTSAWSRAVVDLSAYIGNGDVTLRFRAKNGEWNSADPAVDRIVLEERQPYDYWCIGAFASALPGTDVSLSGNPDGDRLSNEMEWILATDPLVVDSPVLDLMMVAPDFTMIYTRRMIDGIDVRSTWTPSLSSPLWSGDGLTERVVDVEDDVETVEASVPMDAGKKFMRIEVER